MNSQTQISLIAEHRAAAAARLVEKWEICLRQINHLRSVLWPQLKADFAEAIRRHDEPAVDELTARAKAMATKQAALFEQLEAIGTAVDALNAEFVRLKAAETAAGLQLAALFTTTTKRGRQWES